MATVTELVGLGKAGLRVGRFGLGGAPLGGLYESVGDDDAVAVLDEAWKQGLRYFDTAPHYGAGTSERRIGRFLAGKPAAEWVLSTKVGRLLERVEPSRADRAMFAAEPASQRVFDFGRDGVRRSIDESLTRLGVDRIDIVFIHDPDDHWRQAVEQAWPALAELRAEGVIRSVGAGMNQTPMLTRFVNETEMDVVLLAGRYPLLDQSAAGDLLPACIARGTSVVLGGAYNSGVLANPSPGSRFDYEPVAQEILLRAQRIAAICERHGVPMTAAALQFPLAHPAISTVVVGARSAGEVQANAESARCPIPESLWVELKSTGLLRADLPTPGPGT